MKKKFTVDIPDEIWVDKWEENKKLSLTYEGPEKLYALIGHDNDFKIWSEEPIEATFKLDRVVEVDANEKPEIAYFLYNQGKEYEHKFVEETNYDGSIHMAISNPRLHDYFTLTHTADFTLEPILKETDTINEKIARERLDFITKYDDTYDFDDDIQTSIDGHISALNDYLESMSDQYPWKFIEMNKKDIPRIPAKVTAIISSLPEVN